MPSTTFGWRKVKIASRPQGHKQAAPQAPPLASRKRTDGPITLTVEWRGGAEDWWLVKARGRRWVFPGHRQLTDVLLDVLEGRGAQSR